MLLDRITKFFSDENKKNIKKYNKIVEIINSFEPQIQALNDEDFPKKTAEFKGRIQGELGKINAQIEETKAKIQNEKISEEVEFLVADLRKLQEKLKSRQKEILDEILPEAFALTREAAVRVIGERHYDVQLIGGIALHDGNIAEMQTGEGKTLASTCPAYLNSLSGRGVHIVTPNDYLAKRDSQWMGQIYDFLGISTGLIQHGFSDQKRRDNYRKDITYGTNNEFGFDYLRDNMKYSQEDYTQTEYHFAIVDEVDSILIDEARTPLIISGPTEENVEKYAVINNLVYQLSREIRKEEITKLTPEENHDIAENWQELEDQEVVREGDYSLDEKSKSVILTERGSEEIERRLNAKKLLVENTSLFDYENIEILHYVNQALKAHYTFKRDVDYVVQNNQVVIVDEFTGRMMPGRRFSDGLHQALEAKERVTVERENQTLATITFQNYFRLYEKLAGMTGTAETEKDEFKKIYNLGVVVIPPNKPVIREDLSDVIYKTENAKHRAAIAHIKALYDVGRPVLVGTVSIEISEKLSRMLYQSRITHEVLNAKHHEREAEIIANAGQVKAVTIATNMAGRGTDIKPSPEALKFGGLFVLGTGRHDSRRIDNQLRGRSGRQGDPGASQFYLSLEDELLRLFGGERISKLMDRLHIEEDEPIEHIFITKAIGNAQKKVEGHHFDMRKHVLEYDDVMNRQRGIIYKRRRDILSGEIQNLLFEMSADVVEELMDEYCDHKFADQWDVQGFNKHFFQIFGRIPDPKWYENAKERDEYIDAFCEVVEQIYREKINYFKDVFIRSEKVYNEDAFRQMVIDLERQILLKINDDLWKDHLLSMDYLREGIGLVGYAQKKPLEEYKKQGFELFSRLMQRINYDAVTTFYQLTLAHTVIEPREKMIPEELNYIHEEAGTTASKTPPPKPPNKPVKKQYDIGRNDPCFCGSGKKYKKCHGVNLSEST
ncbi:preprotein translocase subunit SecA [Deltaproteobacteria bacterium TL4]